MTTKIYRWSELKDLIPLSRSRIYQLMEKGAFPKPLKLSDRAIGWEASKINAWLEQKTQSSKEGTNG